MLNRVLEISQENRYISLNRGFIVIKEKDTELASIPLDDIAVLLLSAQSVVITKNILNALSERDCITVLCGKNYSPQSMVIPEASHCMFAKIVKSQINASLPLKKRIWQQIVIQKIKNQALSLKHCGKEADAVLINKIASMVDSGDTKNREAYAARMYWKSLFGEKFIRNKDGDDSINIMLNYGYAVMRAGMTRAVCAGGLLPSLGIHHDNNLNQFCLADDLFEIYRPMVDVLVYKMTSDGEQELTPENKKQLVKALKIKVKTSQGFSPALQSMHYLVSSYVHSLEEKKVVIDLPDWEVNNDGITIIE